MIIKSIAPGQALFLLFVAGCATAPDSSVVGGYQGESWPPGKPWWAATHRGQRLRREPVLPRRRARGPEALISYIRAAQAIQPDLQFRASAWSPPGWMKSNGASDSGALIDSPLVYDALARYDLKFLKDYAADGIPIGHIAVQNEPLVLTHYPSCEWTPAWWSTIDGTWSSTPRSPRVGPISPPFSTPWATSAGSRARER